MHSLETQALAGFASRDKDAAVEALAALRTEHDSLLAQQTHLEDLRRTTEQLEHLSAIITQTQTNEPELKELRRVRDRSKVLEGEYAALQRRCKEQEMRATSSDRAASSVRASLAQAQQRAAEWEERANEHESALAEAQVTREAAEDRMGQLAEEDALTKVQLEKKDTEERLAKVRTSASLFYLGEALMLLIVQDRENKLRDQVAALEARVAQLQLQVDDQSAVHWATSTKKMAASILTTATSATAVSSPPRPASRASTIYPSRATTPTASVVVVNTRHHANTPPTSVWDSMHAPGVGVNDWKQVQQQDVSRGRFGVQQQQDWRRHPSRVASPAPSVVSVAPTLGSDGWYECPADQLDGDLS